MSCGPTKAMNCSSGIGLCGRNAVRVSSGLPSGKANCATSRCSKARRVMIPTVNRKDFATLPDEVIDKMQIEFYSDPAQAAFKALVEG